MKKLLALLLVFCLSGCFSGSPNATFYNLSPAEISGIKANPKLRFSVGIEKVVMPDYLKKPQIVTKDKDNYELTQSEFNRWGESLSGMMQRTIALDIAQYLPNTTANPSLPPCPLPPCSLQRLKILPNPFRFPLSRRTMP